MQSGQSLEWVKVFIDLITSWPVVILIVFMVFKKPLNDLIQQFTGANVRKAKIGPIELERELVELAEKGKSAVNNLDSLTEIMAESRLLELEITEGMFGQIFSDDQRQRMKNHIMELQKLTKSERLPEK